uniref:Uncharacterized protein n=1 Tax=Arion vulgaris TaxID=1028688 RepID=A0A0B6YWB2_9EUPU
MSKHSKTLSQLVFLTKELQKNEHKYRFDEYVIKEVEGEHYLLFPQIPGVWIKKDFETLDIVIKVASDKEGLYKLEGNCGVKGFDLFDLMTLALPRKNTTGDVEYIVLKPKEYREDSQWPRHKKLDLVCETLEKHRKGEEPRILRKNNFFWSDLNCGLGPILNFKTGNPKTRNFERDPSLLSYLRFEKGSSTQRAVKFLIPVFHSEKLPDFDKECLGEMIALTRVKQDGYIIVRELSKLETNTSTNSDGYYESFFSKDEEDDGLSDWERKIVEAGFAKAEKMRSTEFKPLTLEEKPKGDEEKPNRDEEKTKALKMKTVQFDQIRAKMNEMSLPKTENKK